MFSHLNLVEVIVASKQFDLSRRPGRNVALQNNVPSFEALLKQNLHKSPSVLPMNNEISPADAKFNDALQFVMEKEGSKIVRDDGGRETSKYGILQSTAREFGYKGNIKDITRTDAEVIYRKLWEKSGAASLPFPLSTVHFDTYVNSPSAAEKILVKSQGNAEVYLRIREQRYARLAETRPEQYGKYLKGWNNRIRTLRTMVAQYMVGGNYKA